MSKLSPYRLNSNYRKDASPLKTNSNNQTAAKTHDKNNKYKHQYNNKRYYNEGTDQSQNNKYTEKKRNESISHVDLQNVIQKYNVLVNENAELYQMLEERGQIIVALERKLQDQIDRQVGTLEAIEIEKNKFIKDSQRKFKDYEKKIEQLKEQVYHLHNEKYELQIEMARQLQHAKTNIFKDQAMKINEMANHQAYSQFQTDKMKQLLNLKHNQISQLNLQYRNMIEKLKNQIITANNDIVHLEHMKKIEISELKIQYDNKIQKIHQFYSKQKDIMTLTNNLMIKQREQIIQAKQMMIQKIFQQKKMAQIEHNIRQNDLKQTNEKLIIQQRNSQQFCKKVSKDEIQRLKDINYNDILALEVNKNEQTSSLNNQNERLKQLMDIKSQQIARLHEQILTLHRNYKQGINNSQNMIKDLKQKIFKIDQQKMQEQQMLKIKLGELRQADLTTLKTYYQHQIQNLTLLLQDKTNLANKNRQLLYNQLQQKEQLRKRFNIQINQLNTTIIQLRLRIDQLLMIKGETIKSANQQRQMTSATLIRQTQDKQRLTQNNEEQRKRLQQLILAKDKQIEQLYNKIKLIKNNAEKEMEQKNVEIQLIRQGKAGIEMELKKEKMFYDNQLKKRDLVIRMNKENYESQMNKLKDNHRNQYQYMIKQLNTEKNELQVQLNRSKNNEKMLKNQLQHLQKKNQEDNMAKSQEITLEKQRLSQDKTITVDKVSSFYNQEIQRLSIQISDLKKKLKLKEQDLRNKDDEYSKLQRKLQKVFESQEKLKKMQKMIIEMGQDNNLVKNMAQLIKNRQYQ